MEADIKCSKCGPATVIIMDSVPYCPTCGKPITPDEILRTREIPESLRMQIEHKEGEVSLELPVPDDYAPSAGELNNFVYLACKYTVGWIARSCDHEVLLMMAGGPDGIRGNAGLTTLAQVACGFCWDHIAGEPDEYDPSVLFNHVKPILQDWYKNTTVEDRAITE